MKVPQNYLKIVKMAQMRVKLAMVICTEIFSIPKRHEI